MSVRPASEEEITGWWKWVCSAPDVPKKPAKKGSSVFLPPIFLDESGTTPSIELPPKTPIFIPVYNVVTTRELLEPPDKDPANDAREDIDSGKEKSSLSLKIDGQDIPIDDSCRPKDPLQFRLEVAKPFRKFKRGTDNEAYADGYHVVYPGFPPGPTPHKIEVRGPISVTWKVTTTTA